MKHPGLKLEVGFKARSSLIILEKILHDKVNLQLFHLLWDQSQVYEHEPVSALGEPNILEMKNPLGHGQDCLFLLQLSSSLIFSKHLEGNIITFLFFTLVALL